MMPVSTSPMPALAMPGLPLVLMNHLPSGSAQTLPAQPKGWPHEDVAPALHDAADVKLDTDGGDAEGS